jgi:short-subunit dehydrogenase
MQKLGTAVITGASSGLGVVFAERLAQRGYDLILIARRGERLETLAKKLREGYHVAVQNIVADLGNLTDLEKVTKPLAINDQITMLVNSAGTLSVGGLNDAPANKQLDMINVNITALTLLTSAVLPGFKQRDHGTIINIGSAVGYGGLSYTGIYGASKAYVMLLTQSLQEELKGTKVIAQLVAPASTATEIWEVGGYSLSNIDPAIVMTAEHCVDAALSGLDQGETVTLPSVEDAQLLNAYEEARLKLLAGTQLTGKPASRYKLA